MGKRSCSFMAQASSYSPAHPCAKHHNLKRVLAAGKPAWACPHHAAVIERGQIPTTIKKEVHA